MSALPNFRTTRRFGLPRWLTEGEGGLVGYTLDLVKDQSMRRLELGLLARFPQQDPSGTPGPEDALVAIGRDRRVVRGIGETSAAYAVRLKSWLTERRTCGTAFTLMRQLAAYTGPGVAFRTVDVRGNWYSRDVNGVESSSLNTGNWDWDGDAAKWSRFWVIVYPGALWAAGPTCGGGLVAGTRVQVCGLTATQEHAATMRALVADWKPAGTRGEVVIAFDDASFDPTAPEPDGTWGTRFDYDATSVAVRTRLSTARYFGA